MVVGDRGAVTVEAALALCSLVAVTALAVAAVGAATAHLRCTDAAREAARLVARGEPDRARDAAARIGPNGSVLEVRLLGDEVAVRVSASAVPGLPALSLTATAHAVLEPAAVLSAGMPGDPRAGGGVSPAGGADTSASGAAGVPP